MKNKMLQKLLAAALVATMAVSMVGCGNDEPANNSSESQTEESSTPDSSSEEPVEEKGITFPLEEEVTFTMAVKSEDDVEAIFAKNDYWQEVYEATNVKVEVMGVADAGVLNALYAAHTEPDFIMGPLLTESDISSMVADGFLMDLKPYLTDADLMPNFNERVLGDHPMVQAHISAPADGGMYSLPKYTAIDGNYLECPFWINKTWVDQLGKELPTTLEELEEILTLFAENDMNGNGDKTDEIPYLMLNAHAFSHMEAFLSLYGIPTKDSQLDSYVYIQDGEVVFAPVQDAYKEAIVTLNRWYENGLIWEEAFTGTVETYGSKTNSEIPVIGLFTSKTAPAENYDDYVLLEPVKVEGYEPSWYVHPGRLGSTAKGSVSASCENVEILMAWIDYVFYSFEGSVRAEYGEEADGRWQTTADGMVEFITITDQVKKDDLENNHPTFNQVIGNSPVAYASTDYGTKLVLSAAQARYQENYAVYKDYMTDEIWPRPIFAAEDSSRIAELRTDIFNTIATKKANWVTGKADIETEWESFKADLEKMNLAEMISLFQKTYDAYIANMPAE